MVYYLFIHDKIIEYSVSKLCANSDEGMLLFLLQ